MKVIAKSTLKLRHMMVKLIAPRLYMLAMLAPQSSATPRPMILHVKARFGSKPLVGAEIGVAEGINAESILRTLNIEKLYLVDPYEPYIQHNTIVTDYVNSLDKARKRLERFRDKISFLVMKSDEAVHHIPDLDFVYIDGNHDYEYVKRDIENYYPKVRNGGVIGGHDFSAEYVGVIKAVTEFAFKKNLEFNAAKADWWINRPFNPAKKPSTERGRLR